MLPRLDLVVAHKTVPGNAVSDAIGGYRIASLLPGDHVVAGVARAVVAAVSAQARDTASQGMLVGTGLLGDTA